MHNELRHWHTNAFLKMELFKKIGPNIKDKHELNINGASWWGQLPCAPYIFFSVLPYIYFYYDYLYEHKVDMYHCNLVCYEWLTISVAPLVKSGGLIGAWGCWCFISFDLWYAGMEFGDNARWWRWMSCTLVSMDREQRRTRVEPWPRDWNSRVTSRNGWHLGT